MRYSEFALDFRGGDFEIFAFLILGRRGDDDRARFGTDGNWDGNGQVREFRYRRGIQRGDMFSREVTCFRESGRVSKRVDTG